MGTRMPKTSGGELMGYPLYLGKMPKKTYDKIKDMDRKEVIELINPGEDYFSVYELPDLEVVYELGKYVDHQHDGCCEQLFSKFTDEDHYMWYCTEDMILKIIEDHHNDLDSYQSGLLNIFEQCWLKLKEPNFEQRMDNPDLLHHLRSELSKWRNGFDIKEYCLDKSRPQVTAGNSSSKYSGIFELVRIYKTFDWDNDILIYYGW